MSKIDIILWTVFICQCDEWITDTKVHKSTSSYLISQSLTQRKINKFHSILRLISLVISSTNEVEDKEC